MTQKASAISRQQLLTGLLSLLLSASLAASRLVIYGPQQLKD
jgi:hypothetical protein